MGEGGSRGNVQDGFTGFAMMQAYKRRHLFRPQFCAVHGVEGGSYRLASDEARSR